MADPDYPVIYWRDIDTKASNATYDTVAKLIDLKPLQVIEIKDSDKMSVTHVSSFGQDNDVAEPIFSSVGLKSIYKQQVGAINEGTTVTLMVPKLRYSDLVKLRSFSRRPNIETAFHSFGNLGFWFPAAEPVFNIEPTDEIGFTLKPPIYDWDIKEIGVDFMQAVLNFSLGGKDLK